MISIHAPRAGGDMVEDKTADQPRVFQSTPPVRGATRDFDILEIGKAISIHAPRAGGDSIVSSFIGLNYIFQSTPPVRGATEEPVPYGAVSIISIHAPRAGGDLYGRQNSFLLSISIHAPRAGGDASTIVISVPSSDFNPRPPCGWRRDRGAFCRQPAPISIHAPRAGGDGRPYKHGKKC